MESVSDLLSASRAPIDTRATEKERSGIPPTDPSSPRLKVGLLVGVVVGLVALVIAVVALMRATAPTSAPAAAPVPAVTIAYPPGPTTVKGTVTIVLRPAGPPLSSLVVVLTGGTLHRTQVAVASFTYGWVASWNTASVPDGTYLIAAVGYDHSGRSATSPPILVTVQN